MKSPELKGSRLVATCMFGALLFNFPVISLFNIPGNVFGVPILYFYIFTAWALLIALMAIVAGPDD